MQNENVRQDDEIDLRELVGTLLDHKLFILIFTAAAVVLSAIYALVAKPTYEVSALVKLGSYTTSSGEVKQFGDGKIAETWLKNVFIDLRKPLKDKEYEISEVALEKNANSFLRIKAHASSNKLATKGINEVLSYYGAMEQKIIDAVKHRFVVEIKNLASAIENMESGVLSGIDREIAINKEKIVALEGQLVAVRSVLQDTKRLDPNTASLKIYEKKLIEDDIVKAKSGINDLMKLKGTIEVVELSKLINRKSQLELLVSPSNIKTYEVVEKLRVSDYPVKPNKSLVVAIAFVTGLILAIFLVFFGQFVRSLIGLQTKIYSD